MSLVLAIAFLVVSAVTLGVHLTGGSHTTEARAIAGLGGLLALSLAVSVVL